VRRALAPTLFAVGSLGLLLAGVRALHRLPGAGTIPHPYGARAVRAAFSHHTANAVMSVTLDQRGLDTLGEELILFGASVGTLLLLRRLADEIEQETADYGAEDVYDALRQMGYLLLPVTLLVGCYVVLHGGVSPGGGFQGGCVLATGLYLAYLAGDYRILQRLEPAGLVDVAEAAGAFAYVAVGLGALATGATYLTDWLPLGRQGDLWGGGTVPVLNVAIGVEVAAAFVLIVGKFLEHARRSGATT
jgi:multicomponent Na+:H+ antiporter subunit B